MTMATTRHEEQDRLEGTTAIAAFRGWRWRAGNALATGLARAGIGPMALLTTTGRVTGRPHTVPVVPIDHAGSRWLVAPYGPVGWVHNVRAARAVTLRYGRQRQTYTARDATPAEAAPVLKRYVSIATRARHRFAATVDDPVEAFIAEARDHPVFELHAAPRIHAG
jgi:deazaflavin-dependent oxidoreductase (nitroreductase family)